MFRSWMMSGREYPNQFRACFTIEAEEEDDSDDDIMRFKDNE